VQGQGHAHGAADAVERQRHAGQVAGGHDHAVGVGLRLVDLDFLGAQHVTLQGPGQAQADFGHLQQHGEGTLGVGGFGGIGHERQATPKSPTVGIGLRGFSPPARLPPFCD
jgi:hypothetical protein